MLSAQRLVQVRSTILRGGDWLDAQSVEKFTYGWAKTLFVMEVIYYFCHFVRYCFPRPLWFPRALRGIVEEAALWAVVLWLRPPFLFR